MIVRNKLRWAVTAALISCSSGALAQAQTAPVDDVVEEDVGASILKECVFKDIVQLLESVKL